MTTDKVWKIGDYLMPTKNKRKISTTQHFSLQECFQMVQWKPFMHSAISATMSLQQGHSASSFQLFWSATASIHGCRSRSKMNPSQHIFRTVSSHISVKHWLKACKKKKEKRGSKEKNTHTRTFSDTACLTSLLWWLYSRKAVPYQRMFVERNFLSFCITRMIRSVDK